MNVVKGSFQLQIRRMARKSGFGQPWLVPIAAGVYFRLRNPLIYKAEWFFADQSVHLPRRQTCTARQPRNSRKTHKGQPLNSHATHSVQLSTASAQAQKPQKTQARHRRDTHTKRSLRGKREQRSGSLSCLFGSLCARGEQ